VAFVTQRISSDRQAKINVVCVGSVGAGAAIERESGSHNRWFYQAMHGVSLPALRRIHPQLGLPDRPRKLDPAALHYPFCIIGGQKSKCSSIAIVMQTRFRLLRVFSTFFESSMKLKLAKFVDLQRQKTVR
jgi:hypothetical protein